jgi:LSD1 subclass zinc finger protein
VPFAIHEEDPGDQYARLFRDEVVAVIASLVLPRYRLANFLVKNSDRLAKGDEQRILANLNRAGRRLIGFCRTNLFKRLESSGYSFLLSVDRHIVRNLVTLHALEQDLPVPIGTQDAAMLDTTVSDADEDYTATEDTAGDAGEYGASEDTEPRPQGTTLAAYRERAAAIYQRYQQRLRGRFDWLPGKLFRPELAKALRTDAEALLAVLHYAGEWRPATDAKLNALVHVLVKEHRQQKVLVFTQFADTARYLGEQLGRRGLKGFAVVTNANADPVALARRFSPSTNGGLRVGETELRVLIATDVLAEGQNLQDAHIVVNFDLPWAIIRLIQRAGRVDRIGQQYDIITVYSFLPADGVDRVIRLRTRLFRRLQQNQEVLGTDESFFGEDAANKLRDLYTEKAGTLDDDEADEDIDLASLALQVWNSAAAADQKAAAALPAIVSATRTLPDVGDSAQDPPGACRSPLRSKLPSGASSARCAACGASSGSDSLATVTGSRRAQTCSARRRLNSSRQSST